MQANAFEPIQVVSSENLSCALIIIPVPDNEYAQPGSVPLWITATCDRTGLEANDDWLSDEGTSDQENKADY